MGRRPSVAAEEADEDFMVAYFLQAFREGVSFDSLSTEFQERLRRLIAKHTEQSGRKRYSFRGAPPLHKR